jgi:hypothetical protein
MLVQSELVGIFNDLLGQKAKLRKGGIQATYHCPFCIDKNLVTQKMEIAISGPRIGNYHCWRCNVKGGTFGSLLRKLNASRHYREAVFRMTGDIRIARTQKSYKQDSELRLPEEFHSLLVHNDLPEYKNAYAYLKRRGVLLEDICRYNIGYCEEGEYEHRIIIPSYDATGKLNFFIGRRYYETPGILPHRKPDVNMNIIGFESFINYDEPLNLCEGVFDALAIRNNSIPLFGKFLQPKLREAMILNGTTRVNMILDKDAMEDAIKNCQVMTRLGIDVYLVCLDGKDPSTMGFEKIHDLIRNAKQFTDEDLLRYKLKL